MLELVTCTLLMVGAPGSLAGCGAPFTHEPFARIWSDTTTGTMVTLAPLAIFTHGCTKFVAFVCTVPLTHPIWSSATRWSSASNSSRARSCTGCQLDTAKLQNDKYHDQNLESLVPHHFASSHIKLGSVVVIQLRLLPQSGFSSSGTTHITISCSRYRTTAAAYITYDSHDSPVAHCTPVPQEFIASACEETMPSRLPTC
jgi:hypothetical protein